jgi:serine/threonine protein kinase/dienelactone hydrolase
MKCPKCQAEISDDSQFCSKCGTPIHRGDKVFLSHTHTILRPIDELVPGTELAGKYKIIDVVGKGGMGIVYKAEDIKLKRNVALKFLPPELTKDKEAKERFVIEAQAAAALSHPNICTIHEINEEEGKSFIAMEYVEGQSLKNRIDRGQITVEEAVNTAIQVAQGMEQAHKKGIVHRDIKSANIMVTETNQAKIMDFGLAKVKGGTLLTREGTTLGTVAYMSPEQARGEEVDHRTDIWSLGIVLYEMLSGQLPFMGDREASVLYSVVHEEAKPVTAWNPDIPPELQNIIDHALKKKPEARYASAIEMLKDLQKYKDSLKAEELGAFSVRSFLRKIRKPIVVIPTLLIIGIIVIAAVWYTNRQAKIQYARQELLPEIERILSEPWTELHEAFWLSIDAERFIPNDPKLIEFFSKCSVNISVKTEPPGAKVFMKEYKNINDEWKYLGLTPIKNTRVPMGFFRWKIEKEDYETVYAASTTFYYDSQKNSYIPYDINRILDKKENIPTGMVRVQSTEINIGQFGDFYIDKYEVTNEKFKEFVDGGGYGDQKYWKHEFLKEGRVIPWEDAMSEYVDQTGRQGPATWEAGDYPEGQAKQPVTGISWHEAAAYAEFAGKTLPTGYHWSIARGRYTPLLGRKGFTAILILQSNFRGRGPDPIGKNQGITSYGAYDMAGNVREWCWNETSQGRMIRGGAWNDNSYMFDNRSQAPAFDRSSKNGVRCATYIDREKIPAKAFEPAIFGEQIDLYKLTPVSDDVFQAYKSQFSYDKTDLNERVEWKTENAKGWFQEKITFEAAYGNERIIAYLFLPKNTPPPYQTVIYFPGIGSNSQRSSDDLESYREFEWYFPSILKNGRAALYPVYKGTFERRLDIPARNTHQYTEYLIHVVKDFKRCIDYLETRPDIDNNKIAYFGMSWGGGIGPFILAVEERIKAGILAKGGAVVRERQEVNSINFIPRVKVPTLMLNGRYDTSYIYETHVKPMFDLLGTPDEHKKLILYDTDHFIPKNERIRETLAWLDKYLGHVK